jgi:hypothetical protein
VTISFAGTIDGQPFEGGSGDDAVVLIGSNTFIPGFEDQLIGISSGETRHAEGDFSAALHEAGARRQKCRVRGDLRSPLKHRARFLRTIPLRSRLVSNRSPSFATR